MKPATIALALVTLSSTFISAETVQAAEKTLWDSWYTVTVGGKTHYGYYNDKVTQADRKIRFQNQFWKQEEGYINEEQLGAIAEDNADLTPVFFSFRSNYRAAEMVIDGNVSGKVLTVKIRKAKAELPPIRKTLPSKAVLSIFFPVLASKKLAGMKVGEEAGFLAVLEDNIDLAYRAVDGRMKVEKPDAFAQKSHTAKVSVTYSDRRSIWYLDPSGNALRIEMPDQKTVVERVPQTQAKNFLGE